MFIYFNKDTKRMTHTCNINNPFLPDNLIELTVPDDFDATYEYFIDDDGETIIKGISLSNYTESNNK